MLEMSCYSITTNKHRKKRKRKKIKTTIKDIPNLFYHTTKGISNPQHKKNNSSAVYTASKACKQTNRQTRRQPKVGEFQKRGDNFFKQRFKSLHKKKMIRDKYIHIVCKHIWMCVCVCVWITVWFVFLLIIVYVCLWNNCWHRERDCNSNCN